LDLQTLTEAAKQWYDAGYCVLPAAADGTKRPATSWREYINGDKPRPTTDELNNMLATGNFDGIGVIAGIASGNLEMIELEGPFEQACEALASLEKDAQAFGIKPLLDDILRGNSEITPTGGIHFFYRVKDGTPLGNTKLAQKIQPDTNGIKVIAETRGQGGWVVEIGRASGRERV
jgi:putative DNA primase/helicase